MLGRMQALAASSLLGIPDGPEGIRATLEMMRRAALAAKINPAIRELAVRLTNDLQDEDFRGEIERLFIFVRDQVRYVQDINNVETVQTPDYTLSIGAGDCDDKATLLASLLESIGHPARFAALAFAPDQFEHVIVETRLGPRWIPLETTPVEGKPAPLGWYPPDVISKMLRHV
jgi:transglutaminase-like putative cysteine protease